MAIKCIIKPKDYLDKTIEQNKVKSLAHAAAKKLLKKGPDVKAPFFLKANHFEGDKVKFKGLFLAIGESPALKKEFKKEKQSDEVAFGNVFFKDEGGPVLYFEYVNGQGKLKKPGDWKTFLKEFKKMIKFKCKFVREGETMEASADSKNESEEAQDTTETANPQELTLQLKNNLKPTIDAILQEHDPEKVDYLLQEIALWQESYDELSDADKTALTQQVDYLNKIYERIEKTAMIDEQIDKYFEKVTVLIDSYIEMDDHSTPEAEALKAKTEKNILKLETTAAKINDHDFVEACKNFRTVLND